MSINGSPQISIIVPVYNTSRYLHRCVESLKSQTVKEIQIVLVDDGSTDDSFAICKEMANDDERIVVLHKENAGQGLARNDGIKAASGKYICFLDSDDYYEQNACEIMINAMEDNQADICSYGYQIEDKSGNVVYKPNITNCIYSGKDIEDRFILHYFGDSKSDDDMRGVSSCMSVFRKSVIDSNEISFPSERKIYSEDTVFSLKYCEVIDRAVTIQNVLYHYCQNEKSFTQGYRSDRFLMIKSFQQFLKAYADSHNLLMKVKKRIAMTAWIEFLTCVKQDYRALEKCDVLKNIKMYFTDEVISTSLRNLSYADLPIKQAVLLMLLRCGFYRLGYGLVGIRVRERL